MKKKIFMYSFIPLIIDQIVKFVIGNNMEIGQSYTFIPKIFDITYVTNTGGAWNILADNIFILIIISIILLLFIIKYMESFKNNKRNIVAFSLLIGGIIGNLTDRIIYGHVIDYFEFKLFSFPVFNLADTFIIIGVLLLVIAIIKGEDDENSK